MTELVLEISPALFSTPMMATVVSMMMTAGVALWVFIGHEYVQLENAPRLWEK
ncbi:hypothetical protein [Ferrimonas pelagia]|uniref:Uncharacterized protein n=1 Tax=Ferrimonas pelagia TaxID=1177826 RepID=A0ABP9EJR2_9GAMM